MAGTLRDQSGHLHLLLQGHAEPQPAVLDYTGGRLGLDFKNHVASETLKVGGSSCGQTDRMCAEQNLVRATPTSISVLEGAVTASAF